MNRVIFIDRDGEYKYIEAADYSEVILKIQDGRLVHAEHLESVKPGNLIEITGGKKVIDALKGQFQTNLKQ